jgi:hypothetical protein
VVRQQGLDLCVLEPGAAPPPPPVRNGKTVEPEDVLPPMVDLPPSVLDDDQSPISGEDVIAPLEDPDSIPVSPEAPEEPEPPADAPGARVTEPTPAPSSVTAPPAADDGSAGAPLDLSP